MPKMSYVLEWRVLVLILFCKASEADGNRVEAEAHSTQESLFKGKW